jgi:transcriptional regulator with XRE-family HTH domain
MIYESLAMQSAVKNKTSNFLSSNIDFLLRKEKLDVKNLSLLTGIPAPSISRLKKEGVNPTLSTLKPISDYFEVDMESLVYTDLSNENAQFRKDEQLSIPILSLDGFNLDSPTVLEHISLSGIEASHNIVGVRVNSESLKPIFRKNTIAIIDTTITAQEGDYVLCAFNQHSPVVFRQVFFEGEKKLFRPIGNVLHDGQLETDYTIVGVVIKAVDVEAFR